MAENDQKKIGFKKQLMRVVRYEEVYQEPEDHDFDLSKSYAESEVKKRRAKQKSLLLSHQDEDAEGGEGSQDLTLSMSYAEQGNKNRLQRQQHSLVYVADTKESESTSLTDSEISMFRLANYIPDKKEEDWNNPVTWLKYGGIIFISLFSSLFYKPFCAAFTKEAAVKVGINQDAATHLSNLSGWASLIVNISITFVTLVSTYDTFAVLPEKLSEVQWDKTSDRVMVYGLVSVIVASLISCAPVLVAVWDTLVKQGSSYAWLLFNLAMQIIGNGAMMIRGALAVLNIESEKKKVAQAIRYTILKELNATLDKPFTVDDNNKNSDLRLLSTGQLKRKKFAEIRQWVPKLGYVMPILYVLGVFAATATLFSPLLVGAGIVVGILATLNILIAVTSTLLILMLIGFANHSLIDMLFSGKDETILNVKEVDDIGDMPIVLKVLVIVVALGMSLLSMGGPSAVVFNYLIPNVFVAFAGGFIAAFGINTGDLYSLLNKYTTIFYNKINNTFHNQEETSETNLPWENKEQFIQSRMLRIANMTDHEIVSQYGKRITSSDDLDEEVLYNGADEYRASEKLENLTEVLQSETFKAASPDEFKTVRQFYLSRHIIANDWNKMAEAGNEPQEVLINGVAAAAA